MRRVDKHYTPSVPNIDISIPVIAIHACCTVLCKMWQCDGKADKH